MSLLGSQVYANPTTPLWGGGGGSNDPNPTFESVTAQDLTLWNPGNLFFYNDASGTAFSVMGIGGTNFSTSNIVVQKQNGQGATVALGAVQVSGAGNDIDSASLVVLDASGLSRLTTGGNASFISLAPASDEMDLMNVVTINGAPYPPALPAPTPTYPSNRFTTQNNAGASVTSSGINVVGLYWEAPANGRVYVNCVCSFTNTSLGTPEGLLTVAANLVVGDGTSIPVPPVGLNTSASAQWEFGVQAGVAYDFVGTAVATNTGDYAANIATIFISFIPS
jgi:hypothetical protein